MRLSLHDRPVLQWIAAVTLVALMLATQSRESVAQAGRNCESIKDDHAYNLCLASQGPRRGAPRAAAPASAEASRETPRASRRGTRARSAGSGRLRGGIVIQRSKGGRVRMIIPGRRR